MSPLASCLVALVLAGGPLDDSAARQPAPPNPKWTATRWEDVDADFSYQGEYLGEVLSVDRRPVAFGLQVTALGAGKFSARGYQDGLPGNGWDRETVITWEGAVDNGVLRFDGPRGRILLQGGAGLIIDSRGQAVGRVEQVRRVSTTLGAAPRPGATILFDGSSTDAFEAGAAMEEGLLTVGALTKAAVQDFRLHLEFRLPYMPYARDQGRAQQWRLHPTTLRSPDPRLVRTRTGLQRLRGTLSPASTRPEHVLPASGLADLRHLLHRRALERTGPEDRRRADHRVSQRRGRARQPHRAHQDRSRQDRVA